MQKINVFKYKMGRWSSFIVISILIIIDILFFISYNDIKFQYAAEQTRMENIHKEVRWKFINSVFQTSQAKADRSADLTAKSIIRDIHEYYPDMTRLNNEIETRDFEHSMLPYIIYKNTYARSLFTVENSRNNCFIILKDGYVLGDTKDEGQKTWHPFTEMNSDIDLGKLFIKLEEDNKINDYTFLYTYPKTNDLEGRNHVDYILSRNSLEELKNNVNANGIGALKDYTFFGVAYITEDGDIFNTPDVLPSNATTVANHKMIVVQKYNLYDILQYEYSDFSSAYEEQYKHSMLLIKERYLSQSIFLLICMVLDLIAIVIMLFAATERNIIIPKK